MCFASQHPTFHVLRAKHVSYPELQCLNPGSFICLVLQGVNEPMGVERDSPLHIATSRDKVEVAAHLLVDAGAHVNAARTDGQTALHLALVKGLTDMVELLAACGADVCSVFADAEIDEVGNDETGQWFADWKAGLLTNCRLQVCCITIMPTGVFNITDVNL